MTVTWCVIVPFYVKGTVDVISAVILIFDFYFELLCDLMHVLKFVITATRFSPFKRRMAFSSNILVVDG